MIPIELGALYPFSSHYFSLPDSTNRLHYLDEGAGEVLVCLHGNPTWSFYFRSVVQHFRSRYRVIVPDHLGCGFSSRPQDHHYSLANHIANLGQLITHLKIKEANLLVHDWGGAIGLGWATRELARKHGCQIKRIAITNTAAFASRDIPKRIAVLKTPKLGEFVMRRLNGFARAACLMAVERPLHPLVKRGLLLPYGTYEDRIGIARFVQDIPMNPKHPTHATLQQISDALPTLTMPIALLWGMKDWCFHPGFLDQWKAIYPGAQVFPFPRSGHYLLEEEPTAVLSALTVFLRASPNECNTAH